MNPMNQPNSILDAILASALMSAVGGGGRGGRRAASEAKNIFEQMFGEKHECGECIACLLKQWIENKKNEKGMTYERVKRLDHIPRIMRKTDEGIGSFGYVPEVYDDMIEFADTHGFKNQAELFRMAKSFSEQLTRFASQMGDRGEDSLTRVSPEGDTGDTQNFTGGRPVEQDKQNDKAPTMNEAPAAAGSSPKRERRAHKDEGPNSVTANH